VLDLVPPGSARDSWAVAFAATRREWRYSWFGIGQRLHISPALVVDDSADLSVGFCEHVA
jgi:hypothetical protein